MPKTYRLEGQRFGRWTVLKQDGVDPRGEKVYLCQCDCGTIKKVKSSNLRYGVSQSCGCLARELTSKRSKTHGMSNTRIFYIWSGMKARCYTSTDYHYKWYGARGITVCDEWKDDFQAFYDWAISVGYSDDLTIDRIDVDGNYTPSNCRWISHEEQMRNTRRNVLLTYDGETRCAKEWSRIMGICEETIRFRKNHLHWDDEKTLTTPAYVPETVSTMLTMDGVTKPIRDWAKEYDIPPALIRQRKNAGWDDISAITAPADCKKRMRNGKLVDADPFVYIAKSNGISDSTYRYRVRKGMSPEEASTKPLSGLEGGAAKYGKHMLFNIDGCTHTFEEWGRIYGISWESIYTRLNRGMDPYTAITKPLRKFKDKEAPEDD